MPTPTNLCFIDPEIIAELNEQEDSNNDPALILEQYQDQIDDIFGERNFDLFIGRLK